MSKTSSPVQSLVDFIPDTFRYVVVNSNIIGNNNFECHLRICLTNVEEFSRWLQDFEEKSNTSWILKNCRRIRDNGFFVVNRNYTCQHSSHRKKRKIEFSSRKDKGCAASLSIRIKKNDIQTRYTDPYVFDGLAGIIKICYIHSHSINNSESLFWLRRSDKTRNLFNSYFDKGMSPSEAFLCNQRILLLDGTEKLSNSRYNPPIAWVFDLHERWLKKKLGDKFDPKNKRIYRRSTFRNKSVTVQPTENYNAIESTKLEFVVLSNSDSNSPVHAAECSISDFKQSDYNSENESEILGMAPLSPPVPVHSTNEQIKSEQDSELDICSKEKSLTHLNLEMEQEQVDAAFCETVKSYIRRIPHKEKLAVQIKILKLLQEEISYNND